MEQAIQILRKELKKARIEYEQATAVCQNPYSGFNELQERQFRYGVWNGLAKAIESLQK